MSASLDNLICFVGARDPRPSFGITGPTGDIEDGPILALLNHRRFGEVFLLCSSDDYFERATQIKLECDEVEGMPRVNLMPVTIPDVIDYKGIYTTLLQAVSTVTKRYEHRNVDWRVLLDPGTPQMQTSWILLVRSGAFPAGLIQGVPPRFNNGLYTCRDVDLSDDAFPRILPSGDSTAAERAPSFILREDDIKPKDSPDTGNFEEALDRSDLSVRDEVTRKVFLQAWTVAQHDHYHHLILGETGTGKSELARWIHQCGPRSEKPMQSVNCATITSAMAESMLFGHKKGAFTGAETDRPGFLRSADGGVLFLDEIGELTLELQARLLHVLDDGTFYPMGSDNPVKADVVIIAATNRDLKEMVEKGTFRQDLYSRLSMIPLTMPPLRDRPEDLSAIIRNSLNDWNTEKSGHKFVSAEAESILKSYNWPRNIRELQQTITRVCILTMSDGIAAEDLPSEILDSAGSGISSRIPSMVLPEGGVKLREIIMDIEKAYFRQAIDRSSGVMSKAAALLGWEGAAFRKARIPDMPKTMRTTAIRYISHGANDLFWFILPLVLPLLLVRYKLTYTRAGGILSFYLAVTAAGSYFMGRISDRIPRRLMMGIGFYIAAAGLIAAGFAGSFTFFLIFLGITGLGVSTFHPAMYAHIDETFKEGKGKVLGAYEASGTAAILLMFLLNGALLGTIGTQGVMTITAVPALIMGTLLIRSKTMDAGIQQLPDSAPKKGSKLTDRHPPTVLFSLFLLSIVLRIASVMAILNFLPTIFTNHFGLRPERAAWAAGLFFAGGIAGSFAAARFSRPDRSYRILVFGSFLLAPLIAVLALDLPMIFHYITVIILGSVGSGLIINQNLILTTLGSRFGRGEAFGILMAVMTLSQSISPALFGLSVDSWGFSTSLLIFAFPVLASAGLLLILSGSILKVTSS